MTMERWLLETPKEEPFHGLSSGSLTELTHPSAIPAEASGHTLHNVDVGDIILVLSATLMESQKSGTG